jgi:hypothetical protein
MSQKRRGEIGEEEFWEDMKQMEMLDETDKGGKAEERGRWTKDYNSWFHIDAIYL